MPLLSRRVEVDTLVLRVCLNLEKDAKGKTNWDDLAKADEEKPAASAALGEDDASPVSLQRQGIQIEDARVSWDDRQAGEKYLLDGVRVVTVRWRPAPPSRSGQ